MPARPRILDFLLINQNNLNRGILLFPIISINECFNTYNSNFLSISGDEEEVRYDEFRVLLEDLAISNEVIIHLVAIHNQIVNFSASCNFSQKKFSSRIKKLKKMKKENRDVFRS
jgi:hypothetical protein